MNMHNHMHGAVWIGQAELNMSMHNHIHGLGSACHAGLNMASTMIFMELAGLV